MASSSNSEFKCSYDIFLSFRGLDTRNKFTDHLYEALKREGFETFRDNEGIERGENINSELQKAIWNSSMSVIVLSKTYATSKSCMFELQTILEHHKKKSDYVIFPVFYEVEPSEIKEQAKNLDFRGKKVTDEEVKGWSAGLKEVAKTGGFVYFNNRSEAKFIEEIIGALKSKQADQHPRDLDENMQNLEREVEYLSGLENDINSQISKAECRPLKRPKREVEVWLTNVQRFKDDVQRLKQEVVGETNVSSRTRLGKDIAKKILEAQELHKKGRDFNSLMIDELSTGRLVIPPMKDFVKYTKARNIENIWECLMNDNIRQIGVYGMGGVGKTTIMKHIHNQLLEEKGMFDVVYWVTVSKPFKITNLQSDIAKSLNLPLREDEEETRRASQLYATLSEPKRYVLILDDVWEPFALDEVGIPEPIRSKGCKLVLTTRSLEVCKRMECTAVKVNLLTEEEALTLFLAKAVVHNTVLAPEVEETAAKIAKECAYLPLAVVTVAGSLRGLECPHKWRNAWKELISSTEHANDDVSKVLEQLKFSYSRLENKVLQDCFLYCSLYPEGKMIPVNKLIEYWIAEELIADMDSEEAQFDKGHDILGKLTHRCLLESFPSIYEPEFVRMHDLIRDMAIRITASNPRFMVKADGRIKSVPNEHWSEDLERISFIGSLISELPITPPVCPRLTTLLLNSTSIIGSVLEVIPDSFFTNMPCLQVLDLSDSKITTLPKSISNLENLHALILRSCWELKNVPSLEKLKALKMFVLTSSKVEELLEGIEELVNLRKLDLSSNIGLRTLSISNLENLHSLILHNCWNLKNVLSLEKLKALKMFVLTNSEIEELPEGIEELVNLRKLDLSRNRILRTFPSWKLRRLSKLEYLRIDNTGVKVSTEGLLCLRQLKVVAAHFHNVQEVTEYVISQRFQGLEEYRLIVGEDTFRSRRDSLFESESESESESDLGKDFTINFDSVPFGSVVDQSVLPVGIESSGVEGFHDTISLSAIPCFKDAKDLSNCGVKCCNWLESIFSSSTISEDGQISLRTVETFRLKELPRLRVLFDGIAPPHKIYFNLQKLNIRHCHALKNIFPVHLLQNFPNLKELSVVGCENLEDIIVEKEEMSDRGNHQDYSNSISLLKELNIKNCHALKNIFPVHLWQNFPNLEHLLVVGCENLEEIIVEKEETSDRVNHQDYSNSISLPKLRYLGLNSLPRLKSIYNGVMVCPSIEQVQVYKCRMVRRLPLSLHMDGEQATPPPALMEISVTEKWWESLEWDDPLTKTILQPYKVPGVFESDYFKDCDDDYPEESAANINRFNSSAEQ